jgi:uncharacterized membrane protein
MQAITLFVPVTIAETTYSTLNIRRPKVRDRLAVERIKKTDAEKEIAMIANLAEVTVDVIEELDLADYNSTSDLRIAVVSIASVTGGGIEPFLDMELEEFSLWLEAARTFTNKST